MRQHNFTDDVMLMVSDMHDAVRKIHVQRPVRIAPRPPHINEPDLIIAQPLQVLIHQHRPLDPVGDRVYDWYDGLGIRRHGLRRGGNDVAVRAALLAERPDPLDISGYYTGDYVRDGVPFLLGELGEVDADIHFPETKEDVISACDLKRVRDAELADGMERHPAEFDNAVSNQSKGTNVTVAAGVDGHEVLD